MLERLRQRLRARRRLRLARTVTLADARARARRGAALLDAQDPGWAERIDPGSLELADGAHCVLGQLHGEFRRGLLRTRIWDGSSAPGLTLFAGASPEALGFYARSGDDALAALDYALLNRAWREEIHRRRDAVAAAPASPASSRASVPA